MKQLKGYCWLLVGVVFFIFTLMSFSTMTHQETSGISKPYPLDELAKLTVCMVFLGLTIVSFSNYWFNYKYPIRIIGIIPERMASSRFPGKPLAKINKIPMVEHVWRAAKKCKILDEVYVCSPDTEIIDYVRSIGGKAIYTSVHNRASDQTADAVEILEKEGAKADIIVMIQGDEPMITPEMIESSLIPISEGQSVVSNLMAPIKTQKEVNDKNTIKVVTNLESYALYFSRQPIPNNGNQKFKQVCVIPFTRDALFKFTSLPQTPLEQAESVDMMRLVENGIKVKMVPTQTETHSVDVPADIKIVERMMKCRKS